MFGADNAVLLTDATGNPFLKFGIINLLSKFIIWAIIYKDKLLKITLNILKTNRFVYIN